MELTRVLRAAATVGVIAAACLIHPAAAKAHQDHQNRSYYDCRYQTPSQSSTQSAARESSFFPTDDLFRPLLANRLEPRFYGAAHGVDLSSPLAAPNGLQRYFAGYSGLGSTFGLGTRRRIDSCNGFQVNIDGAVFSQFQFDPLVLINADYQIGFPLTIRYHDLSARLRLYHQSSHVGDQFLLAFPDFERINLSFEALDLLLSTTGTDWRLYGGAGFKLRVDPADLGRLSLRVGTEFRPRDAASNHLVPATQWRPVAGLDLSSDQARNWEPTMSAKMGMEFTDPDRIKVQRIRLLFGILYGAFPFGQFFDQHRLASAGLEIEFEY